MSSDTANDLPEWVKPDGNEIKVTYSGMGAANVYQDGTNGTSSLLGTWTTGRPLFGDRQIPMDGTAYVRIAPVDLDTIREIVAQEVRKALVEVRGV